MLVKRFHRVLKKQKIFLVGFFAIGLISIIPIRLLVASYQAPYPQAILTLGGSSDREVFTARFAQNHPALEIWVSTGSYPQEARPIFQAAGIQNYRVHLDYRAVDTVTNFTTLVPDFKKRRIQHLYLITSDFHMPRAKALATFVLGSQGITFTPISVPSTRAKESLGHILRDICRCILWIFTRRTGASFNPRFAHLSYALLAINATFYHHFAYG